MPPFNQGLAAILTRGSDRTVGGIPLIERLIEAINRFFPKEDWFRALNQEPRDALRYAMKGGEVVLTQFHGYNDLRDKVVLDYGCGAGAKTCYYATLGPKEAIGVDIHSRRDEVDAMLSRQAELPVRFLSLEASGRIPLDADSVDVAISSAVFEHVQYPEAALREIFRVLKPGGIFLMRWHPFLTRYGGHLGGVIGIPYAHVLFPEKALVRTFFRGAMAMSGGKFSGLLLYENLSTDSIRFKDMGLYFNRLRVVEMRRLAASAGFSLVAERFFRGTRETRFARYLPIGMVDYFIDYDVCLFRKP